MEAAVFLMFCFGFFVVVVYTFSNFFSRRIAFIPLSVARVICGDAPVAEIVAKRKSRLNRVGTDVFEIIAYCAYFAFVCTGCFRIIVGNAFGGVG